MSTTGPATDATAPSVASPTGAETGTNDVLVAEETLFNEFFDALHTLLYEPDHLQAAVDFAPRFRIEDQLKFSEWIGRIIFALTNRRSLIEDTIHYIIDSRVGLKNVLERDLRHLEQGDRPRHHRSAFLLPRNNRRLGRYPTREVYDTHIPSQVLRPVIPREPRPTTKGLLPPREFDKFAKEALAEFAIACGETAPVAEVMVAQLVAEAKAFVRRILHSAATAVEISGSSSLVTPVSVVDAVGCIFPPAVLDAREAAFVMQSVSETAILPWPSSIFRNAAGSAFRGPLLPPPPRRDADAAGVLF